jgi:hypothetical protein
MNHLLREKEAVIEKNARTQVVLCLMEDKKA